MRLERLKDAQMEEILKWAGELDTVITPSSINPTKVREFPEAREIAYKMKRICKWKADDIKGRMKSIEDVIMDSIENEEYVFKVDKFGMPVTKLKYNSADKRARELRFRLSQHEEYNQLSLDYQQWDMMYSDWIGKEGRLRQDMRILEVNYSANGGEGNGI